jgi:hypothetical protein
MNFIVLFLINIVEIIDWKMKSLIVLVFVLVNLSICFGQKEPESNDRYILIEAPCKAGFNALPDVDKKVILTQVYKAEFETPFDMVNAEPSLIKDFEVALEAAYPNSRNQIEDILVYMLNTEKEANELFNRKIKLFKTMETGVIELKIK